MRVQVDKQVDNFQDNGMAVLLLYPERWRSFGVPREIRTREVRPGDGFEVSFMHDQQEAERMEAENKRLLDELLERDG
jgi:hypothetical protein